jgi:hypothetical protein
VVGPEAQGQHVHQATLQEATDFHTAPKHRHRFAGIGQVRQGGDNFRVCLNAVVIGDSQLAQAEVGRLAGKLTRMEGAVAVSGVAMKIELTRAALRRDLAQHGGQGVA